MDKTLIPVLGSLAMLAGGPSTAQEAAWYDRLDFSGDLRLRYESISEQQSADRDRARFRARFGFRAEATDDIQVIVRLATGDGSPVSTNLTFDDGFSAKDIRIDRAYVDWRITDAWHVSGGKMRRPWFRSGGNALLWDSDLNPEGIATSFESGRFFGSVAALSVSERSASDDSLLLTAQGGVELAFGGNATLTAGAGYYEYTNIVGNAPFHDGSANGNSVDAAGNYIFDYSLIELFAEYRTEMRGWPLTVFGEWVQNTEAAVEDNAYALGAEIGETKGPGSYQVSYTWQDTEADAVIGTFNDSDFAGGDTDARGHLLKGRYALRDNVTLGATLIIAELGEFSGNERDYDRVMLDIEFSFR